jgi:hypothetical protein
LVGLRVSELEILLSIKLVLIKVLTMVVLINLVSEKNSEKSNKIARIIQYILYKKQDRKAVLANHLNPINNSMFDILTNTHVKSFKDLLFRQCSYLLGIPQNTFDNPEMLQQYLPENLSIYIKSNKRISHEEFKSWNSKTKQKNVKHIQVLDFINSVYESTMAVNPGIYNHMMGYQLTKNRNYILIDNLDENNVEWVKGNGGKVIDIYNAATDTKDGLNYDDDTEELINSLEKYLIKNGILQ